MILEKYTMGVGDRFGRQAKAQLSAMIKARNEGLTVVPVWNKSHREHTIIKTTPPAVREAADAAVKEMQWTNAYHVDADHIGLNNVDLFIDSSDFFTLDVADFIGKPIDASDVQAFLTKVEKYLGELSIPGIERSLVIDKALAEKIIQTYLPGVKEAGKIYRHIESKKGKDNFITEVSMDETDAPQTPVELFFILAAIADEGIPAQTIAPKFTGRFNKGVDYVGDLKQFTQEFEDDLAVIQFAIKEFDLEENLKLSVHSGSDKFSIYTPIKNALKKYNTGLHLKTAGTTWLEELIGMALAEGEGLKIAKEVYSKALGRYDELCGPYATVIDIDQSALPPASEVESWDGITYANTLRHDQDCNLYDSNFRQLLHVGYKVAAEMGDRYLNTLDACEDSISQNVLFNIYERHLKRIFPV